MNSGIFYILLTQPIYNALIFVYNAIAAIGLVDLGVSIIVLTILIKLVLLPFTAKSLKAQKSMQAIQPQVDAIKKEFKDDKEGQAKAMMELYKDQNVNPLSSCLPLLIQMPILLGLYNVLRQSVSDPEAFAMLYSFIPAPELMNTTLLGLLDLGEKSIILAIIAGIVQYFQAKMLQVNKPPKSIADKPGAKDESMTAAMTKSMTYTMPVITVIFGASLPGGVTLYWLFSNLVSVLQQLYIFKKKDKTQDAK